MNIESLSSGPGGANQAYKPPSMRTGASTSSTRPGSKFSDFGKGPGNKGERLSQAIN